MNRFYALTFRLSHYIETQTMSTKLLLCLTFCMVLFGVKLAIFSAAGWSDAIGLRSKIESTEKNLTSIKNEYQVLVDRTNNPKNKELQEALLLIDQHLLALDSDIQKVSDFLISPKKMTEIMQTIIDEQQNIKLVKIQNLPDADVNSSFIDQGDIHTHGFEMELLGSFSAINDYLVKLEDLPFQIYWDSLSYEIEAYPQGRLIIKMHTLSNKEGWLGV